MCGSVLYFNKNNDKLWTLVSALWCFKVVPCMLIFFLFGNATRIGRYGKIRRSDRTATMVVGVLGAEGSGLSAMRSVDIFSRNANPPCSSGGWLKRRTGGGHGLTARLAGGSRFLSPR